MTRLLVNGGATGPSRQHVPRPTDKDRFSRSAKSGSEIVRELDE